MSVQTLLKHYTKTAEINLDVLTKNMVYICPKLQASIKRLVWLFHHSIRKAICLVQRQNLFIILVLMPLYTTLGMQHMLLVLAPEFVALYTANFCSHSYVRAELEIWPTESYFSGNSNSSNEWLGKNLYGALKSLISYGAVPRHQILLCLSRCKFLLKCSWRSGHS